MKSIWMIPERPEFYGFSSLLWFFCLAWGNVAQLPWLTCPSTDWFQAKKIGKIN